MEKKFTSPGTQPCAPMIIAAFFRAIKHRDVPALEQDQYPLEGLPIRAFCRSLTKNIRLNDNM